MRTAERRIRIAIATTRWSAPACSAVASVRPFPGPQHVRLLVASTRSAHTHSISCPRGYCLRSCFPVHGLVPCSRASRLLLLNLTEIGFSVFCAHSALLTTEYTLKACTSRGQRLKHSFVWATGNGCGLHLCCSIGDEYSPSPMVVLGVILQLGCRLRPQVKLACRTGAG